MSSMMAMSQVLFGPIQAAWHTAWVTGVTNASLQHSRIPACLEEGSNKTIIEKALL